MAFPLVGSALSGEVAVFSAKPTAITGVLTWNPSLFNESHESEVAVASGAATPMSAVLVGPQTVVPVALGPTSDVRTTVLSQPPVTVAPGFGASTSTIHEPSVHQFVLVQPEGRDTTAAVSAPVVAFGDSRIQPDGRVSTASVNGPSLQHGSQVVAPATRVSTASVGGPAVHLVIPVTIEIVNPIPSSASLSQVILRQEVGPIIPTGRWTFQDLETGEIWRMPLNPDSMSPVPLVSRNLRHAYFGEPGQAGVRTFEAAPQVQDLEWGGKIRSKAQYDSLTYWAQKTNEVGLTDHLGRSFTIFIKEFDPQEKAPASPISPWRMRYQMRAVLLGMNEIYMQTAKETSRAFAPA